MKHTLPSVFVWTAALLTVLAQCGPSSATNRQAELLNLIGIPGEPEHIGMLVMTGKAKLETEFGRLMNCAGIPHTITRIGTVGREPLLRWIAENKSEAQRILAIFFSRDSYIIIEHQGDGKVYDRDVIRQAVFALGRVEQFYQGLEAYLGKEAQRFQLAIYLRTHKIEAAYLIKSKLKYCGETTYLNQLQDRIVKRAETSELVFHDEWYSEADVDNVVDTFGLFVKAHPASGQLPGFMKEVSALALEDDYVLRISNPNGSLECVFEPFCQ